MHSLIEGLSKITKGLSIKIGIRNQYAFNDLAFLFSDALDFA
ncbi:MAG: hypothetical protein ABJQ84_09235 [Ekhidna sp.]